MTIFDLYSKRKKRAERSGDLEVFGYGPIEAPFRVQVVHILRDAIGNLTHSRDSEKRWQFLHDIVARERGLFELASGRYCEERCIRWFLETNSTEDVLDFVELSFRYVERIIGGMLEWERQAEGIKVKPLDAIEELNGRFRESALGWQYEGGEIIRVDSQYAHAEIVKPALMLVSAAGFEKANEEFRKAHEHYRHGSYKDCIVAAQRAFESTLKAICTIKKWEYGPGDRASDLIKLVRGKGLFPDYLGSGFDSYIAMLRTGLPEVRNNAGGHGGGPGTPPPPPYLASFALHMTAANIVLLAEALRAHGGGRTSLK